MQIARFDNLTYDILLFLKNPTIRLKPVAHLPTNQESNYVLVSLHLQNKIGNRGKNSQNLKHGLFSLLFYFAILFHHTLIVISHYAKALAEAAVYHHLLPEA